VVERVSRAGVHSSALVQGLAGRSWGRRRRVVEAWGRWSFLPSDCRWCLERSYNTISPPTAGEAKRRRGGIGEIKAQCWRPCGWPCLQHTLWMFERCGRRRCLCITRSGWIRGCVVRKDGWRLGLGHRDAGMLFGRWSKSDQHTPWSESGTNRRDSASSCSRLHTRRPYCGRQTRSRVHSDGARRSGRRANQ
jgi:hypothetical protein